MRHEPKNTPSSNTQEGFIRLNEYNLVLFNDDVNDYQHVVDSLIDVCKHDPIQAEQCTFIAHHKGRCDVKFGSLAVLVEMKKSLDQKGISTMIFRN